MTKKRAFVFCWAAFVAGRISISSHDASSVTTSASQEQTPCSHPCPEVRKAGMMPEVPTARTATSTRKLWVRMVPGYVYDVEGGKMVKVPTELVAVGRGTIASE